jgi:hypothetical protein
MAFSIVPSRKTVLVTFQTGKYNSNLLVVVEGGTSEGLLHRDETWRTLRWKTDVSVTTQGYRVHNLYCQTNSIFTIVITMLACFF